MKKKLIGYIIITAMLLLTITLSIPMLNYVRRGHTYSNFLLTNDQNHVLINNTSFDFSAKYISEISFNSSIIINELITDISSNGIIAIGNIKNSTNNNHGFIDYYKIINPEINPTIQLSDSYLDVNEINETEYLKGQTFNKSLDGQFPYTTIALLKRTNGLNYSIDFLEFDSDTIEFNSTFKIPNLIIESIFDFEYFDVDYDNIPELYLIGFNNSNTENLLLEFVYNPISNSFDLNNIFKWAKGSSVFVDFVYYYDEFNAYFTLTNLLTGTQIYTNVLIISIEKTPIRNLVFESNLTINYDTHIFRAYNSEIINTINTNKQDIALFGTFIENGLDNYPFCLKLTIEDGISTITDEYLIDKTPLWSLDGLSVDIDLDGDDEIIMTTYDLLAESVSDYNVITNSGFQEIDSGLANLRRIKASTILSIEGYQFGIFLGKNPISQNALTFYSLNYIPFIVKGYGEILLEGKSNNLTVETTTLTGELKNRNDISAEIKIQQIDDSLQVINSFPSEISFDIPELSSTAIANELSIKMKSNEVIIHEIIKTIGIDYTPKISTTTPSSIIIIRSDESKSVYFDIELTNNLSIYLDANISLTLASVSYSSDFQDLINPEEKFTYPVLISFSGIEPHTTYEDILEITIKSNIGTFIQTLPIIVTNQFKIIQMDLIIILSVIFALTLIGFIVFMETIYRKTKQSYNEYYTEEKPITIDIKLNKNRAINDLITEYIRTKNWKAGIKIAKDYNSTYLFTFKKFKVQELLHKGQNALKLSKFREGLKYWEEAQKTLEEIGTHEQNDILDWMLSPLRNFVKAIFDKKGSEKATLLQKEFENLRDMKDLRKAIFNIVLDIPLHLVAEQLGLALRDIEELQSSLNYLQLAYQSAPTEEKNRIVTEITSLISLGVTPTEFSVPVNHEEIKDRISKRKISCFSCGEERTNVNEPCSNCGMDTIQCSVCKLPISFGSDYLECYHCQNIAHKEHLLEWVKVKGTCPVCQQKLKIDNLSVAQEKD